MTIPELISKYQSSYLIIHFLAVDDGDCIVINFTSGRLTVEDINTDCWWQGKWYPTSAVIKFLYPNNRIFRYIQSHPDLDHMSGLNDLWNEIGFNFFWNVPNTKTLLKKDFEGTKYKWEDWDLYEKLSSNKIEGCTLITPGYLVKANYWTDDDMWIFGPTQDEIDSTNKNPDTEFNSLSRILYIRYGKFTMFLCGDADEVNMKRLGESVSLKDFLSCSLVKAPHHGRRSGVCLETLKLMKPYFTIISSGEPDENDAENDYKKYTINAVLRTYDQGSITLFADKEGEMWFFNDKGEQIAHHKP